jgi:hypothetical protein
MDTHRLPDHLNSCMVSDKRGDICARTENGHSDISLLVKGGICLHATFHDTFEHEMGMIYATLCHLSQSRYHLNLPVEQGDNVSD